MKYIDYSNATKGIVHKTHDTNTSKTFQINQQQQAWGKDKYANAQNNRDRFFEKNRMKTFYCKNVR